MELGNLYNDVLTSITGLLSAHAIGRLWFCGNEQLNRKLCMSVRRFSLEYAPGERLFASLVWPRLLSQFLRLDDLEVGVAPPVSHYSVVRDVDFGMLSPTLRHCRLKFANAWLEVLVNNNSLILPSNKPSMGHSNYIPFKGRFSNLETLEATNSLADLSVDIQKFAKSAFGSSMVTIRLPQLFIPPNEIKCLGDTVEDLQCLIDWELVPAGADFAFPKYLRSLTLDDAHTPLLLPLLPSSLTYLHLKQGSMDIDSSQREISFPPALTYLHAAADLLTIDFASRLPRTLIHLHLSAQIDCSIESLKSDPLCNPLAHLPPKLETLTGTLWISEGVAEQCFFTVNALKLLPPSIRQLPRDLIIDMPLITQSMEDLEAQGGLSGAAIVGIDQNLLLYLPPSLERLRCNNILLEHVLQLPKKLVSLDLSLWQFDINIWHAFSSIHSLKNLIFKTQWISVVPYFTTDSDGDELAEGENSDDKVDGPILDSLALTWPYPVHALNLGRKWVSQLKELNIISTSAAPIPLASIFNKWLSSLPHTLRSLLISTIPSAIILPESLVFLPRTLTRLVLPGVEINDKTHFASLPPLLTSLQLTARTPSLLKLEDLTHWLPRQIIHLSLPKTHACEDISSLDFAELENALPFLRGRVYIPPITDYASSDSAFRVALDRYGKAWRFLPPPP